MGTGKTTFTQALCRVLETQPDAKSPTFSLVNEYSSPMGPVYHMDLYRLEKEEEAMGLGLEEYFDSGNYCFVEWPEKAPSYLPMGASEIHLTVTGSDTRKISLYCS